ncbi:acyltransferase [Microbacterium sp. 3J1]|uniref:acyltransferase family protein n=1 Tax=Microbacterium sp. 3J1 TaxID=861269 RepID=UPI00159ED8BD|nr:acyltransferase [Microbacterium sp. 3J1]
MTSRAFARETDSARSRVSTQHRIEGLDLLRGVAILLVLIRHSWPEAVGGGGIVGVVIFFTLSGYLITGLLVADLRQYGKVRYGRFYRNRAIRLIPALVFLLIGFIIVEGILDVSGTRGSVVRSVLVSLTYTMNIPGFDHGSANLSHLWTLANEEQFYLIWPLILAVGIRFRRMRIVIALASGGLILWLVATVLSTSDRIDRAYDHPAIWTIAMVIGAAAQLGQASIDRHLRGRRATIGAMVGGAGLAALALVPGAKESVVFYLVGGALIGALTVLVIWKLRVIPTVTAVWKPLLGLGVISYAAYLWNYPITWWLRDAGVDAWAPLAVVLTIVAATVSWFAVERPMNAWKRHLDARARLRNLDPVLAGSTAR